MWARKTLLLIAALTALPALADDVCGNAPTGEKALLWGDLHAHTAWSLDAYAFGAVATPADAFAFARGQELRLATGETTRIDRPLDFAAVTDHADAFDVMYLCTDPLYSDRAYCRAIRDARDARRGREIFTDYLLPIVVDGEAAPVCDEPGSDCDAASRGQWRRVQEAANDADDPCRFTAFVGYEWSATPAGSHWHRNVVFRSDRVPDEAYDFVRYPKVEDLWSALDRTCRPEDGCDVLAIPHNINMADGGGFDIDRESSEVQALRARFERLAEMHQEKGNSECLPASPDARSEDCAFEQLPDHLRDRAPADDSETPDERWQRSKSAFYRSLLTRGLIAYEGSERRSNPLMLGAIGSTDNHLGTPGRVQEDGYWGAMSMLWQDDATRLSSSGYNPGGLVAVWAEQNTRASVFDALKRREAYATSGPRISLRFDALDDAVSAEGACASAQGAVATAMGGTLLRRQRTPRLRIVAGMDQTPLARIQIVKVDLREGTIDEQVHAVADFPAGTSGTCRVWEDPDFDPNAPAYWYARVVELPTPRWSKLLCERLGRCAEHPEADLMIEERAWSSPIWYEPGPGADPGAH
ncbi:MAG: DUF3604 domain-containing protein [Pseudomonadales bacterium]